MKIFYFCILTFFLIAHSPVSQAESGSNSEFNCASFTVQKSAKKELFSIKNCELLEDHSSALKIFESTLAQFSDLAWDAFAAPITIEFHSEKLPFGMGNDSPNYPIWTHNQSVFHIYNYIESDEQRTMYRLKNISSDSRRAAWRKRAIIHAIISKLNSKYNWSESHKWRELNGWNSGIAEIIRFKTLPQNNYDWAYSRLLGKQSAALDFVTLAEELLAPEQEFDAKMKSSDDRLICQEMTKTKFLNASIKSKYSNFKLPDFEKCDAFEKWIDKDTFSHFEIMFAAPSGTSPASLFGHLFLRTVRKNELDFRTLSPSRQKVFEIAALLGPNVSPLDYIIKGLSGGFETTFGFSGFDGLMRQNLSIDQRNIKSFRMNLTEAEVSKLFERTWELERRGYFPYYFLNGNCASFLVELINSILDDNRIPADKNLLYTFPAAAVDSIAHIKFKNNSTLSQFSTFFAPDVLTLLSTESIAKQAEKELPELTEKFFQNSEMSSARDWAQIFAGLTSQDSIERSIYWKKTYEKILDIKRTSSFENHGLNSKNVPFLLLSEILYRLQTLEYYSATLAQNAIKSLNNSKIVKNSPRNSDLFLSTVDLVNRRQKLFQSEDADLRFQQELDWFLKYNSALLDASAQSLQKSQIPDVAELENRIQTHKESTNILALTAIETNIASVSRSTTQDCFPSPSSGIRRFGIGIFAEFKNRKYFLRTRGALIAENLGERRLRGIGSSVELNVMQIDSNWDISNFKKLGLYSSEFTMLRIKDFNRPPIINTLGLPDWLGWGLNIGAKWKNPIFDQGLLAEIDLGPYFSVFRSADFANHFIVGVSSVTLVARASDTGYFGTGYKVEALSRIEFLRNYAAISFKSKALEVFSLKEDKKLLFESNAGLTLLIPAGSHKIQMEPQLNWKWGGLQNEKLNALSSVVTFEWISAL